MLADVGPVPDGEAISKIPEGVLEFHIRKDQKGLWPFGVALRGRCQISSSRIS